MKNIRNIIWDKTIAVILSFFGESTSRPSSSHSKESFPSRILRSRGVKGFACLLRRAVMQNALNVCLNSILNKDLFALLCLFVLSDIPFNFFLRPSRIRVNLFMYKSKPNDKRDQYDWMAEENLRKNENVRKMSQQAQQQL